MNHQQLFTLLSKEFEEKLVRKLTEEERQLLRWTCMQHHRDFQRRE
nr:hypothetical protein [Evansella caseinilytica]